MEAFYTSFYIFLPQFHHSVKPVLSVSEYTCFRPGASRSELYFELYSINHLAVWLLLTWHAHSRSRVRAVHEGESTVHFDPCCSPRA